MGREMTTPRMTTSKIQRTGCRSLKSQREQKMIQILHIPGLQYEGETPEQAEERDRRTVEANRKLRDEWQEGERQRLAPMESMKQWARDRGIILPND